ncbi:hypothetical protein Tco_1043790 [Tanacetum coccineum]|uniref:Uncharacterized protein n=1 Tax=Tanacetum coccineum TaxID=301880 RepID=A0ABQ5GNP7_9ASTR
MSDLKFADTHNLVAFLSKRAESEGFEQIVDFRNANPIKYALIVNPTIYTSCIKQFWDTVKVKTVNEEVQSHALVDKKKVIITESIIRRDLQLEDTEEPITDEAVNEENVPTHSNDLLLSGEDSLKLNDLMEICTKLQQRVLDLENTKTAQAQEISSLKLRVKRLEKKGWSRTHKLKRLFKVGRSAQVVSSEDEGQDVVEKEVSSADPVTTASVEVSAATTTTTTAIIEVDLTLAQALAELRSAKPKVVVQELVQNTTTTTPLTIPKAKSITFRDPGESTTRTTLTPIPSNIKDKGKAKMMEPKKPLKKKEQIRLDEELAFKLQAEEKEQARLAREKAEKVEEANISWDNLQAMIEADRLLAKRLQAREQEELKDEEKARLFIELLEKRKKHFAALRAQKKRNKPPTKAQKKSTMSTYLKHMAGYKQSQLKNKSFAEIQKLFDKAMTRVNMFVDMDIELVKGSLICTDIAKIKRKRSKPDKHEHGNG